MADTIFITFSPGGASSTNYYFSNAGQAYAGSGTPWTSATTTPFEIAMNDTTGPRWTPQASAPQTIFSGGPPFVDGSRPLTRAYPNGQQQIPIQIRGAAGGGFSAYDNALYALQQLKRAIKTATFSIPPIFTIQPNTATNAVIYEILDGDIQETPQFFNDEAGQGLIRAIMTVTWGAHGTVGTGQTLLSSVTYTNNGSAGGNVQSLGTVAGDQVYEGQLMRIRLSGGTLANTTAKKIYAASVASTSYTARSDSLITSSTTGANAGTTTSFALNANIASKLRFFLRVASGSANLQVRVLVYIGSASASPIYTSPWIATGTASGSLIDCGYVAVSQAMKYFGTTSTMFVQPQVLSSDGSATSGTLSYIEALQYYTYAALTTGTVPASSAFWLYETLTTATVVTERPVFPNATYTTAAGVPLGAIEVRGRLPRAFQGASLWLAWTDNGTHTTADTITVTATGAQQYRTLRGQS